MSTIDDAFPKSPAQLMQEKQLDDIRKEIQKTNEAVMTIARFLATFSEKPARIVSVTEKPIKPKGKSK